MTTCPACGEAVDTRYECRDCGEKHCVDCRLPADHDCVIETAEEKTTGTDEQSKPIREYTISDNDDRGYWRYPYYATVLFPTAWLLLVIGAIVDVVPVTPGPVLLGLALLAGVAYLLRNLVATSSIQQ
jgi:hypothetical protein